MLLRKAPVDKLATNWYIHFFVFKITKQSNTYMFDSHYKLNCFSFFNISQKKKQTVNLKTICQIRKKIFSETSNVHLFHATGLFLYPPTNIWEPLVFWYLQGVRKKWHDTGWADLPFTCCTVLIFPLVTYLRIYSTLSLLLTAALLKLYSRTPSCLSMFLADSTYNKPLKIFVFNPIQAMFCFFTLENRH